MQDSKMAPSLTKPTPTLLSAPYWDGCAAGVLRVQRCGNCEKFRFYPTESCPCCGTIGGTWTDMKGTGKVYSWIVVHNSGDAYWSTRVPYVSAIIELDDQQQLYMPGLLTDIDPADVQAGMPVGVWFEQLDSGATLPRWKPIEAGSLLAGC